MADWFTIFTCPKPVETSAPASSLELEPVQGAFNRSAMQDRRNPAASRTYRSSGELAYLGTLPTIHHTWLGILQWILPGAEHLTCLRSRLPPICAALHPAFGGNSREICRNTIDGVYGWTVCQSHPVHFQHLVWSHDAKEPREIKTPKADVVKASFWSHQHLCVIQYHIQ